MEIHEILTWTTHSVIGLVHFCGIACIATGSIGLATAVFQLAFNAQPEATLARAVIQLLLVPTGGYLLSAALYPAPTWTATTSFSRLLLSIAMICAGSVGLAVGSIEMTFYHMPVELWRRMAFYTAVLGVAILIAPFECKMKLT